MAILDRLKSVWNAFLNTSTPTNDYSIGTPNYGGRPDRTKFRVFNERTLISSIYNRMSIDVSDIELRHAKLDELGRYVSDVDSNLNICLTLDPNLDQGPRSFRQDIAMTLFDKGCAAIVPVDTIGDPTDGDNFDVFTMRVGEVVNWYPRHVKVSLYNEAKGKREQIILEKRFVAIVENPFYAVMNEPNSTLQRLIRKLSLLDTQDELTASGKLDIIIQLPYVIKSEARRAQAEQRRQDIEFQLKGSQYGIAYTDGTEKITQLNRAAENNLLKQVEYLVNLLYTQLGITETIMNGTADEAAMLNYFNRTIQPLVQAIAESMQIAFLGSKLRKGSERIKYFRDPFKFVPVANIAEIADKFTRNEILTANEIRSFMGIPPSTDPKADKLVNSNMPQPNADVPSSNGNGQSSNGKVDSRGLVLERNSQNGS